MSQVIKKMNEMRDLIIYKAPVVELVQKVDEIEDTDQIENMASILRGSEVANKPAVVE